MKPTGQTQPYRASGGREHGQALGAMRAGRSQLGGAVAGSKKRPSGPKKRRRKLVMPRW